MQGVRLAGWFTAIAMLVVGAFWMFMWLVGSNGFSSSRGAVVLAGNLLLVTVAVSGCTWFTRRLGGRWIAQGWSPLKAAALATLSSLAAGLAFLVTGSFAVLAVAGA